MEKYTVKNGKKLKYGFTTGSCAAAAAAAAAAMLFSGEKKTAAEIRLPSGESAVLPVGDIEIERDSVSCCVVKDGGDDPDATHGAKIFAKVTRNMGFSEISIPESASEPSEKKTAEAQHEVSGVGQEDGQEQKERPDIRSFPVRNGRLTLLGGRGVGTVTAKGLQCGQGEPAINPVPRKMIFENVKRICDLYKFQDALTIEISVPDGEEIEKKTYNSRLGIIGGISILGTTGIVDPMSEKALVDTIKAVIDKQYAENPDRILIAPGNYGRDFCRRELDLDIEKSVPVSNYIGEALDYIGYKGFSEILLVGHTGKLIKIAAGIMNTHSSYADGRMEVIGCHSAVCGADAETVSKILDCITTDDAFDLIADKPYYEAVKARIMERTMYHLNFRLKGKVKIETVMFTTDRRHMIKSAGADLLAEKLRKDHRK